MTNEEITAKAAALSETHNTKVHAIVFQVKEGGEKIVGYIKEPPRIVKMRMLDKSLLGSVTAASEVLEAVLIKEESDPRIYSEKSEDDAIYLGAVMAAYDTVEMARNQFKKK